MKKRFYIIAILVASVLTFSIVQIMKNKEAILTSSVRFSSLK